MKLFLVYDTETTGLPDFGAPSHLPHQPHIVQAAAQLVEEDTGKVVAGFDLIVKPDGWEIPADVAEIHGITTERALALGVPEDFVVQSLLHLWRRSGYRVGHNESFDARILRIAIKRLGYGDELADEWKAALAKCTARLASPHCNLPPTEKMIRANKRWPKTPTLSEAYRHFFGVELQGAHSAMVDVDGCRLVYEAIRALERPEPATEPVQAPPVVAVEESSELA
jgi:DNA polymerase-3 subunit epsilon